MDGVRGQIVCVVEDVLSKISVGIVWKMTKLSVWLTVVEWKLFWDSGFINMQVKEVLK